jgi:hypothetical protein
MSSRKTAPRAGFLALIFVLLIAAFPRLLGLGLTHSLEKLLTEMFGMRVRIESLRVNPLTGECRTRRIVFENQREFSSSPHFDTGLDFRIRFRALLDKKVVIDRIDLRRPRYLIECVQTSSGSINNVSQWVRHIKAWDSEGEEGAPGVESPPTTWTVSIGKILIHDGAFRYEERGGKENLRLVFGKLEGGLEHFFWRTPDPSQLYQDVHLRGVFGEKFPAPFVISGKANFATSTVSFDLRGRVPFGNAVEYAQLWDGLPINIAGGDYELDIHAVCRREDLDAISSLKLKNLRLMPRPSVGGMLWGLPVMTGAAFLQNEKTVALNLPVRGNISNPKFRFNRAFREAFQDALARYTSEGVKFLTQSPLAIAQKTVSAAHGTLGGIGKVSSMVVQGAVQVTDTAAQATESAGQKLLGKEEKQP